MKLAPILYALALACATQLRAQVNPPPLPSWTFGGNLILEGGASLTGGRESGDSLGALGLLHATWSGPRVGAFKLDGYASAMGLAGSGPTERFVGNFLTASNIEGHRGPRVYSWWLEATAEPWSIRFGSLLADEEFGTTQVGGYFSNSAFGWPAFISANTVSTGPAFYVPVLGVRVRRDFGESRAFQVGVYDGNSFDFQTPRAEAGTYGTHYQVNRDQGAFAMAEVAFPIGAAQLEFGAWLHTAQFDDVLADDRGRSFALSGAAPRSHRGNHGGYASIEQTLAGESGRPGHIAAHLRAGVAPDDRNQIKWALDSGIAWRGPLPMRPADIFSLGYARATHSSGFAQSQRDATPADPAPDFESVIEAGYAAQLSEALSVRPSLQFIRHPGGSPGLRDAVFVLVRAEIHF